MIRKVEGKNMVAMKRLWKMPFRRGGGRGAARGDLLGLEDYEVGGGGRGALACTRTASFRVQLAFKA